MTGSRQALCRVADLPDGASRAFAVHGGDGIQEIFVVHRNNNIVGYYNSCPHTGGPLDWVPGRFLNLDGDLIQCATHDALFRIEDGRCLAGPCAGKSLSPVTLSVEDGTIYFNGAC